MDLFTLSGVAVVDGKIYILGGEDGWEHFHDTIECYTPDTNTWTHVGEMLTGRSWLSCAPLRVSRQIVKRFFKIFVVLLWILGNKSINVYAKIYWFMWPFFLGQEGNSGEPCNSHVLTSPSLHQPGAANPLEVARVCVPALIFVWRDGEQKQHLACSRSCI